MSRIDPKCRQCNTSTTAGFVLDLGHHSSRAPSTWVEGKPEKSFWKGLDLSDREVRTIAAFRCPNCGRLELYATEIEKKK